MSEPSPYSVPTSADPRSKRPTKKRALSPLSQQAAQVTHLFAHPDREIKLPSGPKAKTLAPPPEIVANVQGSSAGAGSGEFHVYKGSRRREYERLRLMDEEVESERQQKEYEERMEELRRKDEEKTAKSRKRRMKKKEKGGRKDTEMQAAEGADGEGKAAEKPEGGAEGEGKDEETAKPVPAEEENAVIIHDDD